MKSITTTLSRQVLIYLFSGFEKELATSLAIRHRDAAGFCRWTEAGLDDLGLTTVEGLFLDHLLPVLNDEECNWIVAWRLGVIF